MHTTITSIADPQRGPGPCQCAPEKVGVRRIRLALPRQCVTANVGSFFAADAVLLAWAARGQGVVDCEFEIVYEDGRTLAGEYHFRRKKRARPALMNFVRRTLQSLCDGGTGRMPVRGLVDGPGSFLAHYDTEDFALA